MIKRYLRFIVKALRLRLVDVGAVECHVLLGGGLQLGDLARFVAQRIALEL